MASGGWKGAVRVACIVAVVVTALIGAACGGDAQLAANVRTRAQVSTTSTEPPVVPPTVLDTTTSLSVTTTVPVTVRLPKVTVPKLTVPTMTLPAVVTSLVEPTTTTTESPLPVPELFDAVQGIGTPCVKSDTRPDGCFFFVYATLATRTWTHNVYSDASQTPFSARDHGHDCGSQANPHHTEREGCSFYFGPVHGRVAGQRECFTATTVSGGRESARSNAVCLTWTDHTTTTTTTSGSSG